MKNGKRIAAILGIVALLAVFALPMFFALTGKEFHMGYFFAALAAAFFVPLIIFIMMEVHRIFVRNGKSSSDAKKNEKREIENIIFDVGQVLVGFDWRKLMDDMQVSDVVRGKMEKAIFRSHIWDERDRGLYEEEYYVNQMVALAPDCEKEIREYMRRSAETITKKEYALSWVRYLKKQGYHLYILSNFCAYMLEESQELMDFLPYMDGTAFSCEIHELKPEAGMYRKLLEMYQLDPKKSVFIDDRKVNVDGAKKLGIKTILFQDFKQAAKELETRFQVK